MEDPEHTDTIVIFPSEVPAAMSHPILVVVSGPGVGCQLALRRAACEIGRRPPCDLVIDSHAVSRRHARVEHRDGGFEIADLGSKNGTLVNGTRVERHRLVAGDLIKLGKTVLKFVESASAEARYLNELSRASTTDPLTGLSNRRAFDEAMRGHLARARETGTAVGLIILDIDHFKHINDEHGHLAGDEVLRSVANVLRAQVRDEDFVGRIGGEEFCLLCRDATDASARALAERVRSAIANTEILFENLRLRVTVSLGVALSTQSEDPDTQRLYRSADDRLYSAKRSGRNRVAVGE